MIKEFQNEYRWLSNFEPVRILIDGVSYPSVEHAYMSQKSDDPAWKEFCSDPHRSPGTVKRKSRFIKVREDWNDVVKVNAMTRCLLQKFNQEPFRQKLINTGDLHIQEGNTWGDRFWGVDLKTGKGQNILGDLIMSIRASLLIENAIK